MLIRYAPSFVRGSRRVRTFTAVVLTALLTALAGCKDDGASPPTSKEVELQVTAEVGGGEPGRTIAVEAYYLRSGGQRVALDADPTSIAVSGTTASGTVTVEALPCLGDDDRQRIPGNANACEIHLDLELRSANGTIVSEEARSVAVTMSSGSVVVQSVTLESGALVPAVASVDFAASEGGQVPAATTVAITSSTGLAAGPLSPTIEYASGTGWLSATVNAGESSVTLVPTTATLAPGRHEATVRIASGWMFTATEIDVAYIVPHPPKSVTITGAGSGTGLVLVTPNGTTCTSTAGTTSGFCAVPNAHGTTITLTPTPATGNVFAGWSGACQGTGACTLIMDENRAVTATFGRAQYTVTVATEGVGSATITSNPAGITCTRTAGVASGSCAAAFDHGTELVLTAAPTTGSSFLGWSGACQGTSICLVQVNQAHNVTATFGFQQRTLTVAVNGGGGGTVTSSPAGMTCSSTNGQPVGSHCTIEFDYGTVVVLTMAPSPDATFQGWSGSGCTGTGTCTVTMDQARTVTATVTGPNFPLQITRSGNGSGYVTFSPLPVSCGADGCLFPAGTLVTILVTADTPSMTNWGWFGGFSGDCTGGGGFSVRTSHCVVLMDRPRTVNVEFNYQTATMTILGAGTGSGQVNECSIVAGQTSGTCTGDFIVFAAARFSVTPSPGSVLSEVSGCTMINSSTCEIPAHSRMPLTARSVRFTFTALPPPAAPSLSPSP